MKNDAMRSAISDALLTDDGTGEEPEAPDENVDATPDAQGEGSTEATEEVSEEVDSEGSDATEDDVPTEYFGVDLSGLPADQRAALIAGYSERDKFIQQLLRNKPEEAAAPAEEVSDEDVLTDGDLLKALGLDDPDDAYAEHTAKVAVPLAKLVLSLQDEVSGLKQGFEVQSTERYWDTSLQGLESQFGKLPISHDEVLKFAAEAGVAEPVDAYWRIMGPARQEVMAEVMKRRAAVVDPIKKGTKGNVRPTDDAKTSEKIIEAKDVNDAMRQALAGLAKERGITFGND